jgi:hypothetical protein
MYRLALNNASRLLSATLGATLMAAGRERNSLWDAGCRIGGCTLLLWAFAAPRAQKEYVPDIVDISSEDSFPASDPPSTW